MVAGLTSKRCTYPYIGPGSDWPNGPVTWCGLMCLKCLGLESEEKQCQPPDCHLPESAAFGLSDLTAKCPPDRETSQVKQGMTHASSSSGDDDSEESEMMRSGGRKRLMQIALRRMMS